MRPAGCRRHQRPFLGACSSTQSSHRRVLRRFNQQQGPSIYPFARGQRSSREPAEQPPSQLPISSSPERYTKSCNRWATRDMIPTIAGDEGRCHGAALQTVSSHMFALQCFRRHISDQKQSITYLHGRIRVAKRTVLDVHEFPDHGLDIPEPHDGHAVVDRGRDRLSLVADAGIVGQAGVVATLPLRGVSARAQSCGRRHFRGEKRTLAHARSTFA